MGVRRVLLAVAALAVAPLVVLAAGPTAGDRDPRSTAPSRAVPVTPAEPTPPPAPGPKVGRAVVRDPQARLGALSVTPGRPDQRIAEWYVCRDRRCYHRSFALVVSGDGFRTSHQVAVPATRAPNGWYLEPAGPDHFAVSPNGGRRVLVDLAGRTTPITLGGSAGPLFGDEVPLRGLGGAFLGVDPVTGAAHRLSVPARTIQLLIGAGGQLRVLTPTRYEWSDDGGSSWHSLPIPTDVAGLVPTTSDRVQAVLLGGDGATLFPWDQLRRSTGGAGWTSYAGPRDPRAYVDTTVVLPDGRLVIDVSAWSDRRNGRPAPRPLGLYAGPDWAHPRPVAMGAPFDTDTHRRVVSFLDVVTTRHRATLYAERPDLMGALSSTDGGVTWRPVRAR